MKSITVLFVATCLSLSPLRAEEIVILGDHIDALKNKVQVLRIDRTKPAKKKLDLDKNPILMKEENRDFFNENQYEFRGCFWVENSSSADVQKSVSGQFWCFSKEGKNNLLYGLTPEKVEGGAIQETKVRVVWSVTIPSTPMDTLESVLFKAEDRGSQKFETVESNLLIRDSSSKKYFISSTPIDALAQNLIPPDIQWREISPDLETIEQTAVVLPKISIDLLGIFRSYENLQSNSSKKFDTVRSMLNFFSYSKKTS